MTAAMVTTGLNLAPDTAPNARISATSPAPVASSSEQTAHLPGHGLRRPDGTAWSSLHVNEQERENQGHARALAP